MPGSSRGATHGHSPRRPGAARVPPERCRRPTTSASAGDQPGGGASSGRERVGGADPARPPRRQRSRALRLGLRSSPSDPRRLPGGGRSAGDQWGPRGRAGGSAHPPLSCPGGPELRAVSGARCSSPLSAPRSLARSTAHTPHTPTHPTPRRAGTGRSCAQRGRPTCDTTLRCPLRLGSREMRFLSTAKCLNVGSVPGIVLDTEKSPRPK